MTEGLKKTWTEVVRPLLRRPPQIQVAALCCRDGHAGHEVLLITSRDTGRWILPKGWLVPGKDAAGSALQEAWEEAGVRASAIRPAPVGIYHYDKRFDEGYPAPVEVRIFRVDVTALADRYPERRERERAWVSPAEAAERVDEPELKAILREL